MAARQATYVDDIRVAARGKPAAVAAAAAQATMNRMAAASAAAGAGAAGVTWAWIWQTALVAADCMTATSRSQALETTSPSSPEPPA